MQIPSRTVCYELIREAQMLEHIAAHSLQVCRVATLLAKHMQLQVKILNLQLIQASALLHDITKTRSFQTGELHSETGCHYLTDRGYPEVGDIVRQHVRLDHYFESDAPTEAEIVNYADKRVLHDQIVSLQDRMDYILQRYGNSPIAKDRLQWLWDKSIIQESRIFRYLPFEPENVPQRLSEFDMKTEIDLIFHPEQHDFEPH